MRNLRYFNLWDFERDGRFYERLGVRWFKRYATQGDHWNGRRRLSDPGYRQVKDFNSAVEWEARTRFNEILHLCSLVVGVVVMGWLYFESMYSWLGPIFLLILL